MKKCSCGGEYERGFIPDFGHMATWTAVWMPGDPERKKSIMELIRTGGGVSVDAKDARVIEAYRCNDCGAVQLFAKEHPPAGTIPSK